MTISSRRELVAGGLTVDGGSIARLGRYVAGRRRQLHYWSGRGCVIWPDGTVEAEEEWTKNLLLDLGEQSLGDVFLRRQTNPNKYLALVTATPLETHTMTVPTFPESETPGTDGYPASRPLLAGGDWDIGGLHAGDWRFSAAEKLFGPNTGASWSLDAVAVVTVATGLAGLYLAALTTVTKSVAQTASYSYSLEWKLQ